MSLLQLSVEQVASVIQVSIKISNRFIVVKKTPHCWGFLTLCSELGDFLQNSLSVVFTKHEVVLHNLFMIDLKKVFYAVKQK